MSNRFSWPAAIVCLLLACSEDRPGDAPAPLPVQSAGVGAELDQQLRGVASCATNDKGELDMKCPGARSFVDWSNKNKAWLDANAVEVSDITRAHLDVADAPATRSVAIRLVALGVKAGLPGSRADLVARMPRETAIHTQIAQIEKQLEAHRHEITMLEADLKETTEVKGRLEAAEATAGKDSLATVQMNAADMPDAYVRTSAGVGGTSAAARH